jgi:hypothetical protein
MLLCRIGAHLCRPLSDRSAYFSAIAGSSRGKPVLAPGKVRSNGRFGSNFRVPGQGRQGPESALCSRWLTMWRMGEDAPHRTLVRLGIKVGTGWFAEVPQFARLAMPMLESGRYRLKP